jgi:hypothetical protein
MAMGDRTVNKGRKIYNKASDPSLSLRGRIKDEL